MLDACLVQFLMPDLEVNGRRHSVARVRAFQVVEHLNVLERVLSCGFSGEVSAAADAFPLQEIEEAFRTALS